jgi:hypothetical protein
MDRQNEQHRFAEWWRSGVPVRILALLIANAVSFSEVRVASVRQRESGR